MKMNKKGFTLIELLAVIVILLAISVMAISSISAAVERNKVKQNNTKKEIIVSYAELYYEEHKNSFANNNVCINFETLKLSDSERVDADGKSLGESIRFNKEEGTWYLDSNLCPNS